MNKMNRLIVILLLLVSHNAFAVKATMTAKVIQLLNSNSSGWGGCMVKTDKSVRQETGLDCNSSWVTFSCTGTYGPKDQAYKMYDSAQMAMVMDYNITFHLDDEKKHNGFCLATRIDIKK